MRRLNDLAVIGLVIGLIIAIVGLFLYLNRTLDSSMFTNGIGVVFISLIVYMGTK